MNYDEGRINVIATVWSIAFRKKEKRYNISPRKTGACFYTVNTMTVDDQDVFIDNVELFIANYYDLHTTEFQYIHRQYRPAKEHGGNYYQL